jgi:hypothetical protein
VLVDLGRFGASDDEQRPRHWQATLRSPSAYRAAAAAGCGSRLR